MKVLLVEDDQLTVGAIRSVLRKRDAMNLVTTVTLAQTRRVVEQGRDQPFDVVLLDPGLPDSRDNEVTYGAVREAVGPEIPIIVITGDIDEELRRRLKDAGVYRVLDKPFQIAELNDAIDSSQRARGSDPPRDSTVEYMTMQIAARLQAMLDDRDREIKRELALIKATLLKVMRMLGWRKSSMRRLRLIAQSGQFDETTPVEDELLQDSVRPTIRERIMEVDWVQAAWGLGRFVGLAMAAAALAYQVARSEWSQMLGNPAAASTREHPAATAP